MKLGIVVPLRCESACLDTRVDIKPGSVQEIGNKLVYCSGLGANNAEQAAQSLVESGVDALVSWGVAGALDPTLVAGDIVLPTHVMDGVNGQRYQVDQRWRMVLKNALGQKCVPSVGRIISTQMVQTDPQEKAALRSATQAVAVDMESAAVAKVASEAGKPFVVIRSIFDTTAMSLPVSTLSATDQYGQVSVLKLISGLLERPNELIHYPALIRSSIRAEKGLRKVLELCGDELCCDSFSTVDSENQVVFPGRSFFRSIPRWSFRRWRGGFIASMESKANMTY